MAQWTGPALTQLPSWRVGCLFLLFLVITVSWEYGMGALDRYLRRKRKRALRHVVKQLQSELLALGLLSLLLVAFEGYLLKERICIDCGDSCSWDCPALEEAADTTTSGHRRRSLLASDELSEYSCAEAAATCAPGSEPFWSQLAMIQAHILIFLIAVVQVLYACVSMLLCLYKLRRWQRFEVDAQRDELRPLHSRFLPKPGDNAVTHALRCTASMLTDSVNSEVYLGLRRLFIARLDVPSAFDFHGFLVEAMEEEFSLVISSSPLMWGIALLWIFLPSASYSMVWLTALSAGTVLVVAVKLQSIVLMLAQQAREFYGGRSVHPRALGVMRSVKLGLQRLSPFGGAGSAPKPQQRRGKSPRDSAGGSSFEVEAAAGLPHCSSAAAASSRQPSQPEPAEEDSSSESSDEEEPAQQEEQQRAPAASMPGSEPSPAAPAAPPQEQQQEQGQQLRAQQARLEAQIGHPLLVDLEAQRDPAQAARAASAAVSAGRPASSVFRRCCPWSLPRAQLPWCKRRRAGRVAGAIQRSQSFAEGYQGPDAACYFWFARPRLVLFLVQFVYLENSLSMSAVLFSLWQQVDWGWGRYGGWPFVVAMVVSELLLLVFLSWQVLPVYALTTAAGSHSTASVIKHALKKQIQPDLARALQRMSLRQPAEDAADGGLDGDGLLQAAAEAAAAGEVEPEQPRPQPAVGLPAALLARHSAPPLALLQRLSPTPGAAAPAPGSIAGGDGGMASPFAAAAGGELDAAAVAAAAAAGAFAPAADADDSQRSLTRLMGAMFARQLQRHLERASSSSRPVRAASTRPPRRRSASLGGDGDDGGSQAGDASMHSAPPLPDWRGSVPAAVSASLGALEEEESAAVETCPASVGTKWLPQLQAQLAASRGSLAAAAAGDGGGGALPADGALAAAEGSGSSSRRARQGSNRGGGAQRATLADVRGLFDEA